jgi:DNA-binding NarL/FixJ family response regulator
VLIVDVKMPGLSGLEVTRHVSERLPHTRVIVLSMYANEAYVLEALRHGAAAYVLKDANIHALVQAVRDVMAGRRYLSPPLSERAVDAYVQKAHTGVLDLYETLTAREREVLHLAAEGRTYAEIAAALGISPHTVETHRVHLMQKLGLRTQADLIRYALQHGILPMQQWRQALTRALARAVFFHPLLPSCTENLIPKYVALRPQFRRYPDS